MNSKALALEFEKRWALPAAVASFLGAAFLIVSVFVGSTLEGNDGLEYLRSIEAHHGAVIATNVLQGLGLLLFVFPVFYLFRAVGARTPAFRSQFIGVIVVAPIFLAAASILNGISLVHASSDFFAHAVPEGAKQANQAADDARNGQGLRPLLFGLSLGGLLGFAFSLLYCGLHAMRTGLLTRFWGSLGMAVGVLMIFIGPIPIAVIWFFYIGLLYAGWVPGGRPPAWAAGEAIPPPSPGERMAAQMDPRAKGDYVEGEGSEITAEPEPVDAPDPIDAPDATDVTDVTDEQEAPTSARELGELSAGRGKRKRRG